MPLSKLAKIGIAWGFAVFTGISGFIYSKNSVVTRRTEDMKIRQRIRDSNRGEYEPSPRKFSI